MAGSDAQGSDTLAAAATASADQLAALRARLIAGGLSDESADALIEQFGGATPTKKNPTQTFLDSLGTAVQQTGQKSNQAQQALMKSAMTPPPAATGQVMPSLNLGMGGSHAKPTAGESYSPKQMMAILAQLAASRQQPQRVAGMGKIAGGLGGYY